MGIPLEIASLQAFGGAKRLALREAELKPVRGPILRHVQRYQSNIPANRLRSRLPRFRDRIFLRTPERTAVRVALPVAVRAPVLPSFESRQLFERERTKRPTINKSDRTCEPPFVREIPIYGLACTAGMNRSRRHRDGCYRSVESSVPSAGPSENLCSSQSEYRAPVPARTRAQARPRTPPLARLSFGVAFWGVFPAGTIKNFAQTDAHHCNTTPTSDVRVSRGTPSKMPALPSTPTPGRDSHCDRAILADQGALAALDVQ